MKNDELNDSDKEKNVKRAFSGRIHKIGYPLWPAIATRIADGEESPRAFIAILTSLAYTVALMLVGVFIGNFVSAYKTPASPESDWTGFAQYNAGSNREAPDRSKDIRF